MQFDNKDPITGWAFAYLAAIDEYSYKTCREKLFEYAEFASNSYKQSPQTEASNYMWTLVMNLYASASAGNKEDYLHFLNAIKSLSDNNSLKEATLLVPTDDYRQWLVSLARASFTMMEDKEYLKELEAISDTDVKSFDSMLAWANEILALNQAKLPHGFYNLHSTSRDFVEAIPEDETNNLNQFNY